MKKVSAKITDIESLEILKICETVDVECKEGENKIPNSLWKSYSAMANINGGIIILGIKENKGKGTFEVQGVKNVDKRIQDFWNTINGSTKLTEILEGMNVLIINVPRANYRERPIYLNENQYKGTYKRNAEGDYRFGNPDHPWNAFDIKEFIELTKMRY
ncbi:RNA-binding domain-containing protein [Clostridium sp. YIM B02569]|uniref:AlbA family DNA-binding domain-containing protein n=1 Tax=Clostridium sp. YIM B02569 TaxID=2911967 RepID=UPI001EEF089A|nr:RNA-binding domain-containing protein [Clostridium sp. YIM B02569]